jgi:hypothetical protein
MQILIIKILYFVKKLKIYNYLITTYDDLFMVNKLLIEYVLDNNIIEVYNTNLNKNNYFELNHIVNYNNYKNLNYDFSVIIYKNNNQIVKKIKSDTILKQPVNYKPILVEINFIDTNDNNHILKLDLVTEKYNYMIIDNIFDNYFIMYLLKYVYNMSISNNLDYTLKIIDQNMNIHLFTGIGKNEWTK